jgi:hypothetical protein
VYESVYTCRSLASGLRAAQICVGSPTASEEMRSISVTFINDRINTILFRGLAVMR